LPVILFSHGLGGSRDGYSYLGRHWASYGYVSVHLEHEGSDRDILRGQMANWRQAMDDSRGNPTNAIERVRDVQFAIDQLERLNIDTDWRLSGRLDLDRIGMAGHSFGANTTLLVAGQGQRQLRRVQISMADPRIKAAIPMSAPVPMERQDEFDQLYDGIRIPCLHMTGTLDNSTIGDTTAEQRRIPFDRIRNAEQYLVTFIGGDHMVFSGRTTARPRPETDPLFHDLILRGTTAFWDAYLRGDGDALTWLRDGYRQALGDVATYEVKRPGQQPAAP